MKYLPSIDGRRYAELELTRRNLQALLDKLDDPDSARTFIDPDDQIIVTAVEDAQHYADRRPGPTLTNGVFDATWPGAAAESEN